MMVVSHPTLAALLDECRCFGPMSYEDDLAAPTAPHMALLPLSPIFRIAFRTAFEFLETAWRRLRVCQSRRVRGSHYSLSFFFAQRLVLAFAGR
jgi:hypothetical protein